MSRCKAVKLAFFHLAHTVETQEARPWRPISGLLDLFQSTNQDKKRYWQTATHSLQESVLQFSDSRCSESADHVARLVGLLGNEAPFVVDYGRTGWDLIKYTLSYCLSEHERRAQRDLSGRSLVHIVENPSGAMGLIYDTSF